VKGEQPASGVAFPGSAATRGSADAEVGKRGWNLLSGDLSLPQLVLKQDELDHNVALMARYCERHGVSLAPHAKTTMAPEIVARQLDAGAWGITVANVEQAVALRELDAPNVLLANELADPASLRAYATLATEGPSTYFCLVDSLVGLELLEEALASARAEPQNVLLELGVDGGRAGSRDTASALALAERIGASTQVRLAGLEAFEGAVPEDGLRGTLAAVDSLLARLRELAVELDERGAFSEDDEIVLSAGGSAYFDRVIETLSGLRLSRPVRVVLRSGCYVTHDCGLYSRISPLAGRGVGKGRLRNALELWACVLSRPEPGLAIVGFGKRDASYDIELPIPLYLRRRGAAPESFDQGEVLALNDQHAIVRVTDTSVAVGDWLCFGISHPCTSFDKWRTIPLVNDAYDVIDLIETLF
jgi:D-serine dehydratase